MHAVVLLCAFVALAGCDWTQIGFGPGQTNANPDEAALSASTVEIRNVGDVEQHDRPAVIARLLHKLPRF